MVVTDQSANLSMLSPSVWLYKPGSKLPIAIGSASSTADGVTADGVTVSYSLAGVQAGQTYLIRALGNAAGDPTGGFGLEVTSARRLSPRLLLPTPWWPSSPTREAAPRMRLCRSPRVCRAARVCRSPRTRT